MARNSELTELLEPVVSAQGCELWGLEYHGNGRHRSLLRLYIEKSDGVTLTDCERVSRQVSSVLDVEDPIQGEYTLEVSSPGMDRPLYKVEHYQQFVGERVKVKLRVPFEGRRQFSGILNGVENDEVKVLIDEEEYLLPIEAIEKANLVPSFADNRPGKPERKVDPA